MKTWLGWFCAFLLMYGGAAVGGAIEHKYSSTEWLSTSALLAAITATAIWGIFY